MDFLLSTSVMHDDCRQASQPSRPLYESPAARPAPLPVPLPHGAPPTTSAETLCPPLPFHGLPLLPALTGPKSARRHGCGRGR